MELCDVVDKFGNRTERIVERGTRLNPGEYYLVVHVWIKDEVNNYLIQQRALHLESDPGVWCITVGYITSGEESIDSALREVKEELGIQLTQKHLNRIDRHVLENRVEDVWVAIISKGSTGVPVLSYEVADYKWVSRDELERLVKQGKFFKYSYLGKFF